MTNCFEAVDLPGLDDEDVSGAAVEGLAVYRPYPPALTDELDFVIRMTVWTRPPNLVCHGTGTLKHWCCPAQLQHTHANHRQKAPPPGARDASLLSLRD